MSVFKAKDIFDFAIKIEEKGEKFYREVAHQINIPEVSRLFEKLAKEEVDHKKTFLKMATKLGNFSLPESTQDEFYAYIDAYTQNLIFNDAISMDISKIKDAKIALTYAIDKELDSVLYYTEIRNLIPFSEQSLVDAIIDEERKHVIKISILRKTLSE